MASWSFVAPLSLSARNVATTSPYPPPKHTDLTAPFVGADDVRRRFFFRRSYTASYALAALPAVSIPGGFTAENLPIGLQLGARPFAEATLLQAAHAYEQATDWHTRCAPAVAEDGGSRGAVE